MPPNPDSRKVSPGATAPRVLRLRVGVRRQTSHTPWPPSPSARRRPRRRTTGDGRLAPKTGGRLVQLMDAAPSAWAASPSARRRAPELAGGSGLVKGEVQRRAQLE